MKKYEIKKIEISEEEKQKRLEYTINLCKLVNLRKKQLITDKEFEILKVKIKNI